MQISWQHEFDDSADYVLTNESYRDAFERTIVADATRDFTTNQFSRPGKVKWSYDDAELDPIETSQLDHVLTAATGDRRLFFAKSSAVPPEVKGAHSTATEQDSARLGADCKSFVMGLGRSDVAVGDEIWALKGGQVLYILRRTGLYALSNVAETPEPDWPHFPSIIWLNGKSYPWTTPLSGASFEFVGECYVHGLMDGEALDIASLPPAERPEILKDMASDFEEIFVGSERC